jgi:hypothetical protein
VKPKWILALQSEGYRVRRVEAVPELGEGTDDIRNLVYASERGMVLLTGDEKDFADPPRDDHRGIVIVDTDADPSGAELVRATTRILTQYPDLSGNVAWVTEWL